MGMKVSITLKDRLADDPIVAAWLQKAQEEIQADLDALRDDLSAFGSCCYDAKTGVRIAPEVFLAHGIDHDAVNVAFNGDSELPDFPFDLSRYFPRSCADLGINPGTGIQPMIVDPPQIK